MRRLLMNSCANRASGHPSSPPATSGHVVLGSLVTPEAAAKMYAMMKGMGMPGGMGMPPGMRAPGGG